MRKHVPLLLMLGGALSACTVGPDYHAKSPTELGVPDSYSVPTQSQQRADLARWWARFDDPMLGQLVEQGRASNLDIAQAVTRLRQAHESLLQARAQLLPGISATGGYSRNVTVAGPVIPGVNRDVLSLGADVSYQLDLFGGNRSNAHAASEQYEASGFDYANVMISTEAEIARNYILARLAQAQLDNARSSLGFQDENLQIAGWRVQAGLVSSLDAEQARTQRANTAATVPQIEANYNSAVSRLGVLTGQAPGALKAQLEATKPIPTGPTDIAVGIPADTLRQRPDVRSSERALAAATARIGVAEAQLYPALSVGGNFSATSAHFEDIFNVVTGQLFANVAQTIFDGGRLHSQLRSSKDAADGAFLAYKSSVLGALEDVEVAITALRSAETREGFYTTALEAANNSAVLARGQYRAGLVDFTTLITSEAALLQARNNLSQAQSDKATALVQLFLALGGGWDSSTTPSVETVSTIAPQGS
jgi:NodT family efflux transporter outer membrane factor (OMF) lipoprotein